VREGREPQVSMLALLALEARVPVGHRLRAINVLPTRCRRNSTASLTGCMPRWDSPPSHRNGCWKPHSLSGCIRSAASAPSWRSWITICFLAGSWTCPLGAVAIAPAHLREVCRRSCRKLSSVKPQCGVSCNLGSESLAGEGHVAGLESVLVDTFGGESRRGSELPAGHGAVFRQELRPYGCLLLVQCHPPLRRPPKAAPLRLYRLSSCTGSV